MQFEEYVDGGHEYYILEWRHLGGAPNVYVHDGMYASLWLFGDEISDASIQRYFPEYRIVDAGFSIPVVGSDRRVRNLVEGKVHVPRIDWAWVCSDKPLDYINSRPPPKDWPDLFPPGESWAHVNHLLAFPSGEHKVGELVECCSIVLGAVGVEGSTIQKFLSKQ